MRTVHQSIRQRTHEQYEFNTGFSALMRQVERAHDSTSLNLAIFVKEYINAQTDLGWTALMIAADKGKMNFCEQLLAAGANPRKILRFSDRNALMIAIIHGNLAIVKCLLKHAKNSVHGIDIDYQDHDGLTALMHAIQGSHTQITDVLLVAGANVNLQEEDGRTALMFAANNEKMVQYIPVLLANGADPTVRERMYGKTALMIAARKPAASKYIAVLSRQCFKITDDMTLFQAWAIAIEANAFSNAMVLINLGGIHPNARGWDRLIGQDEITRLMKMIYLLND